MIQIEETKISKLIFHHIDLESSKPLLNESLYDIQNNEDEDLLLKKIFLMPFLSNATTFEFKHDIDIELNPLFKVSQSIFDEDNFIENSQHICQHLKSVSKHPNIKAGDLFIIKFEGIKLGTEFYDGLGIYKIENKEGFIETSNKANASIKFKKGIGTKRLDKACLILFTEKPYTVFVIDTTSTETDYWQNEFLKLVSKKDNVNDTNQFLTLTKTFVTKQFPSDFETTKADQIDLLNRSVNYFKKHDNFDKQEFEQEVLQDKHVIESFNKFDTSYREEHEIEIAEEFPISQHAVKKQARVFKSVLKLDKNFHIYIHGNRDMIEQGIEKDGRKYYKIYFDQES